MESLVEEANTNAGSDRSIKVLHDWDRPGTKANRRVVDIVEHSQARPADRLPAAGLPGIPVAGPLQHPLWGW